MPNGELFKIPAFPTAFTSEDVTRLEELEEQRKAMEEAYKGKFSREAWAKVPGWEKAAREILPGWITPAIRAAPGIAETWEFGFTPEQFQKTMLGMEEEYKELVRRQKITALLPNIQTGIVIAALAGKPILDASDLMSTFPELQTDFTEEEINYLARLSQVLAKATPEEIASGELFAYEPGQLPITKEDVEAVFPEHIKDPRFILSTVAFSKDMEAISAALKEAYPPEVTQEQIAKELQDRIREYFRQMGIEQGIIPEGEAAKEAIKGGHKGIAEDAGAMLVLKDEGGQLFPAVKKADNSVWSLEGDLLGYWLKETKTVVPISPGGQPLPTEEARESTFKDLWDAFYLSLKESMLRVKQCIFYTYPASLLLQKETGEYEFLPGIPMEVLDKDTKQAVIEENIAKQAALKEDYNKRNEAYYVWLEEHPELQPRPEWVVDTENLGFVDTFKKHGAVILKDPSYLLYLMADNASTILAFAATIGVAYGTRNPYLTIATGTVLFTPLETQDLYEDLIASGASEEYALEISPICGAVIGSVESLGALPIAKAVSPVFFAAFRKNVAKQMVKMTTAQMAKQAALQAGKIEAAEVTEEIIQEILHNAFVQTVDENRELLENVPEVLVRSIVSMFPLSAFGGGMHFNAMRHNLPPGVRAELDSDIKKVTDTGASLEDAQAAALVNLMQTETGQEQVMEAFEKTEEQITPAEITLARAIVEEFERLEERISIYNEEMGTIESSLETQKQRLEKMKVAGELPGTQMAQRGLIKDLEERLIEVEKDKNLALKKIQKARDKLAAKPISEEITPEGYTAAVYRGIRTSPLDSGLVGKATYYTTSPEYAQTYGKDVEQVRVQLKNPLRINSQAEWDVLSDVIRVIKERAARQDKGESWVQQELRTQLEKEGYDGVIIAPGIVEIGAEIAVFYPQEAVTKVPVPGVPQQEAVDSTTSQQQILSPWLQADPLLPIRRPRAIDWEEEQVNVERALENPRIKAAVKLPPQIVAVRDTVTTTINRLQDEYEAAKEAHDKEAIEDVEGRLKEIASDAGLRKKALLGKRWDDLPPTDKIRLVASAIPDKSLKFSGVREGLDMTYYMQMMEELTGAPWYSIYERIEKAGKVAETTKELILQRITTDPHFKGIRTDEEALARVAQEVNARNKIQGVEHPDNITENEMLLADAGQDIYNRYKPIVRYTRVVETKSTMEAFKEEFPDAVDMGKELELEMAIKLKEEGNLDDLWAYLFPLEWGVIEHGFDPRLISAPDLRIGRRGGLRTTRGKGRLMRRVNIEYPAGKMAKNYLARMSAYVEQMEIQWRIAPEVNTLADWWNIIGDKFENWGQMERGLETWLERVQGIGLGYNWFDRQVRRLWRQAMAAVFLEPFMSFRNSFQAFLFHPDRLELARVMWQWKSLPAPIREQFGLGFSTFISELGGLRRDWLHVGERGFLVPDPVNRLADSVALYGKSDNYPRMWSAMAAFNKAYKAFQQYKNDGNVERFVKDSGLTHLRQTERNYALTHFLGQAEKKFDLTVPGLRQVNADFMTSFYIANRIADITHFKYKRSARGLMEMGKTGTTLWNLVVFPRGYAQRLYFQAEKIRNAFKGEATWAEARSGFMDIMKLVTTALLFSQLFFTLTGRRRNPWNPLNILFGWEFGGLFVGIAQDVTVLIGDLATILNPHSAEEDKQFAINRLPSLAARLPETLIPFFRRAVDIAEVMAGKEGVLPHTVRRLRAMLDDSYTPEELEEFDRSLWEKIKKAILGARTPDPTELQQAMENIEAAQTKLGTMGITGRFYTLGNFGGETSTLLRDIPEILITEQEGFTPLVLFYRECEAQWAELFTLPSDKRDDWRKEHILEEAMLLFWEKYKRPVFKAGTQEAEDVKALLLMWFDQYEIDKSMHHWWTSWELPEEIPLPEEVGT